MCGRYVSVSTPEQIAEAFAVDVVRADALPARYNVAPTLDVYAVIDSDDERRLGTLRWGLVPYWASEPGEGPRPINARIESIDDKPMFAGPFARRRCLLPADGFYEWQRREETRAKQPWFIADPDGTPLAFAGIWSVWRDRADDDAPPLYTAAIVTTRAAGAMADLHPRMPLMLPRRLWDDWLRAGEDETPHLKQTVSALGAPALSARPISTRVNNVRNEGPELLEPAEV